MTRSHRHGSRRRRRTASWFGLAVLAGCIGISAGAGLRLLSNPEPAGSAVPLMSLDTGASQHAVHRIVDAPAPTTTAKAGVTQADHVRETTAPAAVAPVPAPAPARVVVNDLRPEFDGRKLVAKRTVRMLVTAYSPDERSCGIFADGITASGKSVWTNGMKLVAADTRMLPFGTVISVPGYNGGKPVQVLDRGGKIKGHRLDVLYPTHEIARVWGKQYLNVTVYEYADE